MPDTTDQFLVPELTRGLRHFASPSALGSDHAVYFAPLLRARRAAHEAALWTGRLAAFDAHRLRGTWNEMLAALAAERFPRGGADQRALIAELEECTASVFSALDRLGKAGERVRSAGGDAERAVEWGEWIGALKALFVAADDSWSLAVPVLADSRGSHGRWWRRVVSRKAT
jgi:hypothetical protein